MPISKNAAINVLKKYFNEKDANVLATAMIVKTTIEAVAETPEQQARRGNQAFVGDVTSAGVDEYNSKDVVLTDVAETPEEQARRGDKRFVGDVTRVGVKEYKPVKNETR